MKKMSDDRSLEAQQPIKKRSAFRRFFGILGPGLVTGSADDDPSGIATYSQAGATYPYATLWTAPLLLPLMMAVQEICDRTALVTGDSLGSLVRKKFTRGFRGVIGVLLVALIAANCLNLSADLMAIGQGMQLLHAGPAALWSVIAGGTIMIALMAGSFTVVAKIFKWLCVTLLLYLAVLCVAHVRWSSVVEGLLGMNIQFSPAYLGLIVAVLGTSISPYMFFWQSEQRIEEMRAEELDGEFAPPITDRTDRSATRKLFTDRIDVFTGMAFSVLIMFAISVATAATLGENGHIVTSAADAAQALEPIAGNASSALFALGFIGSGILAVPILAASGAAGLAGLLNKSWGLERSPRKAPVFYGLIAVGIVVGTVFSVIDTDPITLLVLSAVVNGIAAGPFLIVLMLISNDRTLMGTHRNGKLATTLGWLTTLVMCIAGGYGTWFTLSGGS